MAVQLDDIRASVEAFGLPVVSAEEHEADDVIDARVRAARSRTSSS